MRLRRVAGDVATVACGNKGLYMRRGWRGLVADVINTGQFADGAVCCAANLAAVDGSAMVWGRGTNDKFPSDCRAPRERSIHKASRGASRRP